MKENPHNNEITTPRKAVLLILMEKDEQFIARCITLASNAEGRSYPNPLVGSLIVHKGLIIGEGWHQKAGGAHAEVHAINSVADQSLLKESTIYVSLEPCSHYGKTPPCSDLIIARGIKKVVIGSIDPFSEVAGRGIKKLMEAGCQVKVGVLEEQCKDLNKRFFTFHLEKRPYIILKWAESLDRYIAPAASPDFREPVWISNRYSKQLVHKYRAQEQAILVGTHTAIADNPKLNTRSWYGPSPVRIVLDQHKRIPEDSHLFDGRVKTIRITGKNTPGSTPGDMTSSENLITEKIDFSHNIAGQICDLLYSRSLQSVIIEGGSQTLQTFIDAGLWDEARIFTGSKNLGSGIASPTLKGNLIQEENIAGDTLRIYHPL